MVEDYPFQSKYIKLGNFNCHYVDEGFGSIVLMIHGNPTWSFYFRNLIKDLSKNYRAIAIDHIGCGLSEKPSAKYYNYTLKQRILDLEEFIQKLNLKNINLILHDWGGAIGLGYVIKHTENIKSITITNTSGFLKPKNAKIPLRLLVLRKFYFLSYFLILYCNAFVQAAIYMAPYKKLTKIAKNGLVYPYDSVKNRIAILKFVMDIPLKDSDESYNIVKEIDENLKKLNVPVLILWGEKDFVFNLEYFKEWKKRLPNSTTYLFKDAGHYLLEDKPKEITEKLRCFYENNAII